MKTIRISTLIVLALFGAGTLQAGNGPGRKGFGPRNGNAAADVCSNSDCPQAGGRARKGKNGKADGQGQGQRARRRDGSGGNGNGKGKGNGRGKGNGQGQGNGPGDGSCGGNA